MTDSTIPVRLCARRPAYGLLLGRDSTIGGGVGISPAHATVIGAGRAVPTVAGPRSAGERLPARSLFLAVQEPLSTGTPRGLIRSCISYGCLQGGGTRRDDILIQLGTIRPRLGTSTRSGRTRRHNILPLPLPHDTLTGTRGRHDELADSEQAERSTELPDDATERTLVARPFRC